MLCLGYCWMRLFLVVSCYVCLGLLIVLFIMRFICCVTLYVIYSGRFDCMF